jgi:hypothetical protein
MAGILLIFILVMRLSFPETNGSVYVGQQLEEGKDDQNPKMTLANSVRLGRNSYPLQIRKKPVMMIPVYFGSFSVVLCGR